MRHGLSIVSNAESLLRGKVGEVGMKHNVPVQFLIDHIKTAIDVDPWAKEMVEELLKEQENASKRNPVIVCPHCGKRVK